MIRWKVRISGVPLAVAVLAGLAAPAWADYESALAALRSGGDVAAACMAATMECWLSTRVPSQSKTARRTDAQ